MKDYAAMCGKCWRDPEKSAWDCLSESEQSNFKEAMDAAAEIFRNPLQLNHYCDKCSVEAERECLIKENREILVELSAEGLIPTTKLEQYLHPWKEAIAANRDAWVVGRDYSLDKGNLFLHGPEGVGKTALARYVLMRQVFYQRCRVAEIQASMFELKPRTWSTEAMWMKLSIVPLLLIDDLSSANFTSKGLENLFLMVDKRATMGHRTIITSNKDDKALYDYFDRVAHSGASNASLATSLLRRLRPVKKLHMTGKSLRKKLEYGA